MTKEELEKEAEEKGREWERSVLPEREEDYTPYSPYYPYSKGYIAGYEAREAYNKKLLDSDIEKHNKIVKLQQACHKWFMRWREAKKDALYFDSSLQKQIEATYKVVEELNEAKEIISEFIDWVNWQSGGNCPSFKRIQDKAEAFLKED